MDMLEIGRGLSEAEERTHFGMWCIQSSPLLIGCDMTGIPASSLQLIKNRELIAVNQDPLALQARIVKVENGVYLYVKDVETLNGTTRAIAIYNPTESTRIFNLQMSDIDLDGTVQIRDLFTGEDLQTVTGGTIKITVGRHDTKIFRLKAERRMERTVYEAETAWLERYQDIGMNQSLGYANYSESSDCSGGAKVGWLGNHPENWMEWRDVYSEEGGAYEMTLRYVQWDNRFVDYSINGNSSVRLDLPATEQHSNKPAEKTVRIVLKKGFNTIRLSNATAWAPDIDKMTLKKIETTGIASIGKSTKPQDAIKVYNKGRLTVSSETAATISIWDMNGIKRLSMPLTAGNNVIDTLPEGIYYILRETH